MKCRDTRRAIKSLVCGEKIDPQAIRGHLSECPRCRERFQPVLEIIRSTEGSGISPLSEEAWRQFSLRLHSRMEQGRPAPLGGLRSFLLWVGQSSLVRLRKAVAFSAASLLIGVTVVTFLLRSSPDLTRPPTLVQMPSAQTPVPAPDLPPAMTDVLSIFGPGGFVTGVFSGYIQPGDFFGGHELDQDQIIEALDYLLS